MKIECANLNQVMARLKDKTKDIEGTLQRTAAGMGVLFLNEIHPLTNKKSHTWDNSIHAEVKKLGAFKVELWVGSKGAFNGAGYNYGARQERLFHPIERGRMAGEGPARDLFQRNITAGLGGRSITQNIRPTNIDEFASMAGF